MTKEGVKQYIELSYEFNDDDDSRHHNEVMDYFLQALEYDDAKYHEEHGEVIVAKEVWEDAERALRAIDDIKSEINQICEDIGYQRIHKDDVFKIIDKHIGERSEDEKQINRHR